MRNVALELAPYGIRCNAISPGAVKTPMTNHQDAWDMFAGQGLAAWNARWCDRSVP
jgi:NAD(P)-dependent dehydrogenase (short-subunit alcohol dehydrogenase family)